jgi:hypothetical protein
MSDGKRGAKRLGTRDWVFGSAPRRALLATVLQDPAPRQGWTKADLARAAGVSPNGGIDEHVAGLASLRLLTLRDGRWFADRTSGLGRALRRVLVELDAL